MKTQDVISIVEPGEGPDACLHVMTEYLVDIGVRREVAERWALVQAHYRPETLSILLERRRN